MCGCINVPTFENALSVLCMFFKAPPLYLCATQVLYIMIDITTSVSHVLNYFGVLETDIPAVRIINMETQKKFKIDSELTVDSLRQLSQDVVDDTAQVTL